MDWVRYPCRSSKWRAPKVEPFRVVGVVDVEYTAGNGGGRCDVRLVRCPGLRIADGQRFDVDRCAIPSAHLQAEGVVGQNPKFQRVAFP